MIIKTLSKQALSIIDQYQNFEIYNTKVSIPYFNNKRTKVRAALRVYVGKGSPFDIKEEVDVFIKQEKLNSQTLDSETILKILVAKNIGLDCSGFSFYILRAEARDRNKNLEASLHFPNAGSFFRKIIARLRPVNNADVKTFGDNKNSKIILPEDVHPGDIITMMDNTKNDINHMLVVENVEYQNNQPMKIGYVEICQRGILHGSIEILNGKKPILDQVWSDSETFKRAFSSRCELRRLVIF